MSRLAPSIAVMAICLTAPAFAQTTTAQPSTQSAEPHHLNATDSAFFTSAAYDNQAEINLCLVAEKKTSSPAIQAFARLMVDDHVQIASQLAALSNEEKIQTPDGMGPDGQKTYKELSPLTGHEFDVAFMKAQIEDHSQDIERFHKEAANTPEAPIRRFTELNRPILEQHLALAKAVMVSTKDAE